MLSAHGEAEVKFGSQTGGLIEPVTEIESMRGGPGQFEGKGVNTWKC